MLLETSFCGTKPSGGPKSEGDRNGTKVEAEVMEKVLLARKHDPTQAILAEGINVVKTKSEKSSTKPPLAKADESLKQTKCDVTITLDKPTTESNNTKRPSSRIVADSGVEYIYIPLKGPLPADLDTSKNSVTFAKHQKLREVKSLNYKSKTPTPNRSKNVEPETRCKSASSTPPPSMRKQEDAKYIRIRLKPDRCYSDEAPDEVPKPNLDLDLDKIQTTTEFMREMEESRNSNAVSRAEKRVEAPTNSVSKDTKVESPSPSVSRRSSFASLFKGKGAMSPESPSVMCDKRKNTLTGVLKEVGDNLRTRSRSRSKSRDRDSHKSSQSPAPSSTESIDSKSKHKSVLSLFKTSKKDRIKYESDTSSQENVPIVEGTGKVEYKCNERKTFYENPLESASIRIPLHSPTYYENRTMHDWKTSSQDSQETVIEAPTKHADVIESAEIDKTQAVKQNSRQDSTTSENVVFSTKLGSNEVFSTKLPKKLSNQEEEETKINGIEAINSQIEKLTLDLNKPEHTSEVKTEVSPNDEKKHSTNEVIKKQDSNESTRPQDTSRTKQNRLSQVSVDQMSNGNAMAPYPEEDQNSSGSEREPLELSRTRNDVHLKLELDVLEPERKAIVFQQDSFEDELPYIPTTLPLERSAAVPIVPIKQRSAYEVKTFSIERPKSTTPMNPNCLEEYCEVRGPRSLEEDRKSIDKIKISLPRNDSFDKTKSRKGSNTTWTDFAERGISRSTHNETPPPLPPKSAQKAWVNVDSIPEKRKAPKRIQTIPSLGHIEVPESVLQDSVIYNYVNPEECKCECHEAIVKDKDKRNKEQLLVHEDELPLLADGNREEDKTGPDLNNRIRLFDVSVSDCNRSIISDSSVDLSMSNDLHEAVATETTLHTPFTGDFGLTSNRSSIVSQDDHHPPDSPNAFPKTS
ncbi:unnamed protein product [Phaedon cochleariae]|uniref:Uncharacterized protein n=1 Tax=Phaedon cochleariae TaxID=80249 RepID=A0A9P0DPB3_PHACE|nr:unnamed protein product [Phaedon cochleariae]